MKKRLFSLGYFGSIDWWAAVVQCPHAVLEAHESYIKQSYRNRCYIDSPNGNLLLNVPVTSAKNKLITTVEISHQENWAAKHKQALRTTYRNSAFYETIAPAFFDILDEKPVKLWDLNLRLFKEIAFWLRLETKISVSEKWENKPENVEDCREVFDPKKASKTKALLPYPQVFDHKNGFSQNLFILDLLFNEGPAAFDYLKEVEFVFSPPS